MSPRPKPAHLHVSGRPEGWNKKGMLKSAPSVLHNLHFPVLMLVPGVSTGRKRHLLLKKRERQAQEAGACTEHHPQVGCFQETGSPPATAGGGRLVGDRSNEPRP